MKKILMINFGGIGDEILFMPTIQSIKTIYPNSEITLCVEPRSRAIKDLCPLVDKIITADIKGKEKCKELLKMLVTIRKQKFDIAISSGKSPAVAIILFLSKAKTTLGFKSGILSKILLTHEVNLNENQYAANMYHDLILPLTNFKCELPKIEVEAQKVPNSVLIHPGVSKMSVAKKIIKTWPTSNWRVVIEGLLERGYTVLLAGGPDDEDVIKEIGNFEHPNFKNMYGKTKNIMDLAKLIKSAEATICADSAPMHMAVGLNVKTIAIFGPTNETKLLPLSENFIALQNGVKCRPCLWHNRLTTCEGLECLKINPHDIFAYFNRLS